MGRIALHFLTLVFASLTLVLGNQALAEDPSPECLDGSKVLQIDAPKVLGWISTSNNSFLARARVAGRISEVLPDQTGHDHFLIQIGPKQSDVIEAIYNAEFGKLPKLAVGQEAEACGDYITTKNDPKLHAQAIIHWIHKSDNPTKHESGYIKIDGLVYGLEVPVGPSHHHAN